MGRVLSPVVVGRQVELAEIGELLVGLRAGRGGMLALTGEPGVGKSRLAQEARAAACRLGVVPFIGRATSSGSPFEAFATALLRHGRRRPLPRTPQLEPFRSALGVLVPDWAGPVEHLPHGGTGVSPALMAEGLVRLMRTIAPRGALLVLEDLHWADPETIVVLDHLADDLADDALGCLATLRAEEPGRPVDWLATLCARRVARRLDLPRLTMEETLDVARACLATTGLAPRLETFLLERSDGLPLLVEDLLADLVTAGTIAEEAGTWVVTRPLTAAVPRTFADTVRRRLTALEPATQAIVSAAAVIGAEFDWHLLAGTTGATVPQVLAALRSAVDQQILTTASAGDEVSMRFRHVLTREVVLAELLPPERAASARAAAEVIEGLHPGLPGDWCLLAAELHAAGGRPLRSAELLAEGGRRALRSGALASAGSLLRRARAMTSDASLADSIDAALTEVLTRAGLVDEALTVGEGVLARSTSTAGRPWTTGVRLQLARAAVTAGRHDRATAHLDAVLAGEDRTEFRLRADGLRALAALSTGNLPEAEAVARGVLRHAHRAGVWDVVCESLDVLGRCVRHRDVGEAEELFDRAYRTAVEHELDLESIRALHELGTIDLFESGRTDRLRAARQLAEQAGDLATAAHVDLHLGVLLAHRDDVASARHCLLAAASAARRLRLSELERVASAQLGYALALAGREREATPLVEEVLAGGGRDDAWLLAAGVARPVLRLLRGERAAALRDIEQTVPSLVGAARPQWGLRALLRAVDGDRPEAAHREAWDAGGGAACPPRLNRAYLGFARAVLSGRAGDADGALAAFAAADRELGWQSAHRWICWWLVAEAATRDGWGEPGRWSREMLPEAERRRMTEVVAAYRSLLERAGIPVPRRAVGRAPVPRHLTGLGVTSREAEVLVLVARGLSNPQIAAALHLSRRTVESHVAHLLAKTGAAARRELGSFADSVGSPA